MDFALGVIVGMSAAVGQWDGQGLSELVNVRHWVMVKWESEMFGGDVNPPSGLMSLTPWSVGIWWWSEATATMGTEYPRHPINLLCHNGQCHPIVCCWG